ncbi:MAG: OmpA family protein [Thiobacillaceae bacterium]
MKNAVWFLAVTLALGGCASQPGGADKATEASICRKDFASLEEKSKADLDACMAARTELQAAVDKDTEASAQQADAMKAMEGDLRDRLKTEIAAKDVEIERLRSKLSVHVLDRVLFTKGSADILPGGLRVLDKVAAAVREGKETIRVEGHTDDLPIGADLKKKYFSNWELSSARASAVVRYFEYHSRISPTRMEVVGFSQYRPFVPNDSDANRKRNRRVEIILTAWNPESGNAPSP